MIRWTFKKKGGGMLFCDDCKELSITEEEQKKYINISDRFFVHWCEKYNKHLTHSGYHPRIPRLKKCNKILFRRYKG